MKYASFGKFMSEKAKAQNLAITDIAEYVNESTETARRWIRGMSVPSPKFTSFARLAQLLHVPEDELLREIRLARAAEKFSDVISELVSGFEGDKQLSQLLVEWAGLTDAQRQMLVERAAELNHPSSNGTLRLPRRPLRDSVVA